MDGSLEICRFEIPAHEEHAGDAAPHANSHTQLRHASSSSITCGWGVGKLAFPQLSSNFYLSCIQYLTFRGSIVLYLSMSAWHLPDQPEAYIVPVTRRRQHRHVAISPSWLLMFHSCNLEAGSTLSGKRILHAIRTRRRRRIPFGHNLQYWSCVRVEGFATGLFQHTSTARTRQ
jgi:hypothetical protein